MSDFHSHVADDDVRRISLPAMVWGTQPVKQGAGWTLLGDLEEGKGLYGTPGVLLPLK